MKVCLIEPGGYYEERVEVPYTLLMLGAALEPNVTEVKIVDLALEVRQGRVIADGELSRNAAKLIAGYGAEILGFAGMGSSYPVVLGIAEEYKKIKPESIIIFGGPQATFVDLETLKNFPFVDIIVRGEGELTIVELIDKLENGEPLSGVKGITYREGGEIVRNEDRGLIEDVDTLPFPAYHLLPMDEYWEVNADDERFALCIEGGRGCPYRCAYCPSTVLWRGRFRPKTPERILREVKFLKEKYGINTFRFLDDAFTIDRTRVEKICDLFIKNRLGVNWVCSTRTDHLDSDLLETMKEAGCSDIFYGVETASTSVQKDIRKGLDLENTYRVIEKTVEEGIFATVSFIIGFPGETEADLNNTLNFAIDCGNFSTGKVMVQAHLLALFPGTELFDKYKDRLEYSGSFSDMGTLIYEEELKERIGWIREYPLLFSVFYNVGSENFSTQALFEIRDLLLNLILLFDMEKMFLAIYRRLGIEPLDFFEKWKEWMEEEKGITYSHESKLKNLRGFFAEFLIKLSNDFAQGSQ